MTQTLPPARYGINSYKEWVAREGIRINTGIALDLFAVDLGDWPRYGVPAAIAEFAGSGDYGNMFVIELPAGKATLPQRHLYEEVFFILEGRGSTQVEFADGSKRSFEWGPRSFFSLPLNVKHRHFNGSGSQRALMAVTTNLPQIINIFHNDDFVFNLNYEFADRRGKDEYYVGEADLYMIRQGNNFYETNFIPDMGALELTSYDDRGPGSSNIKFVLADGIMYAHMSEVAPATYKKAHRHRGGVHVMTLSGGGYSLLWDKVGDTDFTRVDWKYGTVFPPVENQFHQHFVTSNEASRYVATSIGSIRYPITESHKLSLIGGGEGGKRQGSSTSIKDGGDQIEYEDQHPRIHEIWLEEMRKNGVTPRFSAPGVLIR